MKAENTSLLGSADNNTRTIARNSFWNAVEVFSGMAATVLTTIAVARIIGKDVTGQARLGSYQYIVTLTSFTLTVGTLGLPATTRKYMAEYLNCGEPGVARAMYLGTLKLQSGIALVAAALGFAGVFWLTAPQYTVAALLLVAAMVPRLIAYIPSSANSAAEVFRRNTGPGLAGTMVTAVLTIVSLLVGWEFVGLSAAVLVGSVLECALKLRAVERWMAGIAPAPVAPELRRRMFAYSGQGLALLVMNIVVWDRSDVLILQAMNPDTRQILFFSTAFSLAERVLMIPAMFGGSLTLTMMAQYGRGRARLKEMTVDGARYALLVALPLLLGMACLSGPLVLLVYGKQYRLLIPTLAIVALLAIPKVLVSAPTMLLQTTERQGFLIWWGCLCGAVDIGLDLLLTPHYGANGAAVANGTAQLMAAVGMWAYIRKTDDIPLRLGDFGRIAASGAVMALGVLAFTRAVPGNAGMFASVAVGAALWTISLRVTAALRPEDASRFLSLGGQLPAALQPHWKRLIDWLAPAAGSQV
jgi:O-antigen/teichoic acid export membrane protein